MSAAGNHSANEQMSIPFRDSLRTVVADAIQIPVRFRLFQRDLSAGGRFVEVIIRPYDRVLLMPRPMGITRRGITGVFGLLIAAVCACGPDRPGPRSGDLR